LKILSKRCIPQDDLGAVTSDRSARTFEFETPGNVISQTKVNGMSVPTQLVNVTELHVSIIFWNGIEWSANDPTPSPTSSPTFQTPAPTTGVSDPTHFWDFRGCADGVSEVDIIVGVHAATVVGTTTCTSSGMVLDGSMGNMTLTITAGAAPHRLKPISM